MDNKENKLAETVSEAETVAADVAINQNIEVTQTVEVVINPTPPQKKKHSKIIYWALIAVFASVFVFSAVTVLDYIFGETGTVNHNQTYDDLRDLHQRPSRNETPSTTTQTPPSSTGASDPAAPTDPTQPSQSKPTDPADPTDPQPTEPKPTQPLPTDPTDPTDPTEPQPTDPTDPTDPLPTEPTTQPTEPTTRPTEPTTQPTEPTTRPTEPPQPTVTTKPPHVNTTILSEMKAIYALNNDVVGWIYIEGTNIDYPVLQRKSDPDYYLYRDFYGKDDPHGSIYAEEHCNVFTPTDVVTLYGHHMADGTMFKDIYYYTTESYFKSHPYVYFDTLYTRHKYAVVLLFRTNGEPHSYYPFFPFHTYNNFRNEADFDYFMSSIRKLKLHESGVEVNYGDKLLCLSTCDYMPYPNGRLVLVCKMIEGPNKIQNAPGIGCVFLVYSHFPRGSDCSWASSSSLIMVLDTKNPSGVSR